MVMPDNPKGIRDLQDIVRTKARFINRQRGSGTRLAVEKMLKDQGIDRGDIDGFYSEEFTHLAVAAAVASGMADVGVGIEAAAKKLGCNSSRCSPRTTICSSRGKRSNRKTSPTCSKS